MNAAALVSAPAVQELNKQRLMKHATRENMDRIFQVPENIRVLKVCACV